MLRKMTGKKGFTLVEVIIVLVILAILAAILIPALTGYIDKANEKRVIAEARMVLMAAQTEVSELYGKTTGFTASASNIVLNNTSVANAGIAKDIADLSEIEFIANGPTAEFSYDAQGQINDFEYKSGKYTVTFENGAWQVS